MRLSKKTIAIILALICSVCLVIGAICITLSGKQTNNELGTEQSSENMQESTIHDRIDSDDLFAEEEDETVSDNATPDKDQSTSDKDDVTPDKDDTTSDKDDTSTDKDDTSTEEDSSSDSKEEGLETEKDDPNAGWGGFH